MGFVHPVLTFFFCAQIAFTHFHINSDINRFSKKRKKMLFEIFENLSLSFTSLPHLRTIFVPHLRHIFPKHLHLILPQPQISEISHFPTLFEIQRRLILKHFCLFLHILTIRTRYPYSQNLQVNRTRLISSSFIIKVRIFLRFHHQNFFISFLPNPTVYLFTS